MGCLKLTYQNSNNHLKVVYSNAFALENNAQRFLSVDPLSDKYPHNSPYAFSENRVIDGVELEGLEYKKYDSEGNIIISTKIAIVTDGDNKVENFEMALENLNLITEQLNKNPGYTDPKTGTFHKVIFEIQFTTGNLTKGRGIVKSFDENDNSYDEGALIMMGTTEMFKSAPDFVAFTSSKSSFIYLNPNYFSNEAPIENKQIQTLRYQLNTLMHEIGHDIGGKVLEHTDQNQNGKIEIDDYAKDGIMQSVGVEARVPTEQETKAMIENTPLTPEKK
jgi:hypothetical protein